VNLLKTIYRHPFVQLPIRGIKILSEIYILSILKKNKLIKIKQFEGKHQGNRCFIVATGPSLNLNDVEMLKNEICFSCNSIINIFEKTDWRPAYYVVVDSNFYKNFKNDIIIKKNKLRYFFHPFQFNYNDSNSYPLRFWRNWCLWPYEWRLIHGKWRHPRMGLNTYSDIVYEGSSVIHVCMQLAFYMGFNEIYLLGTDCNYFGEQKHSKTVSYNMPVHTNNPEDMYKGLIADYKYAKKIANEKGIKVYNATRGGMLEVFERVNLEDVLKG
jgi:hypothetical protein